MTVDYLIELLKSCDFPDGFSIGVGFLPEKGNSASVEPDGKNEIVRSYCDGGMIMAYGFSLLVRLKKSLGDNAENLKLTEKISDCLTLHKDLPECDDGIPLAVEVTGGAVLEEDNIHSLKYRMKCRLLYLKEDKNNG